MRNRHQTEARDLEKAGLNRILSLGGQPPIAGGSAPSINALKSSAVSAYNESRQTNANIKVTDAQAGNLNEQANANSALTKKYNNEAEVAAHSAQSIKAQNEARKIEEELLKKHPWLRKLKVLTDSTSGVPGLVGGTIAGGAAALAIPKGKKPKKKVKHHRLIVTGKQ